MKYIQLITGILIGCMLLTVDFVGATDVEVKVVGPGDDDGLVIQVKHNLVDFDGAIYIYDIVLVNGVEVAVNADVNSAWTTLLINGLVYGSADAVLEARALSTVDSFDGYGEYLVNKDESDGFFHLSAEVVE